MALPSIFTVHLLLDWFDLVSLVSVCPIYPSVTHACNLARPRIPRASSPCGARPQRSRGGGWFRGLELRPARAMVEAARPSGQHAMWRRWRGSLASRWQRLLAHPVATRSAACSPGSARTATRRCRRRCCRASRTCSRRRCRSQRTRTGSRCCWAPSPARG